MIVVRIALLWIWVPFFSVSVLKICGHHCWSSFWRNILEEFLRGISERNILGEYLGHHFWWSFWRNILEEYLGGISWSPFLIVFLEEYIGGVSWRNILVTISDCLFGGMNSCEWKLPATLRPSSFSLKSAWFVIIHYVWENDSWRRKIDFLGWYLIA